MIYLTKSKNRTPVRISFIRNQSLLTTAFLTCFMFVSPCLFSQDSLQIKIDNYVRQQQRVTMTPGVAVAVINHGKVLLAKGYGLSNVELATYTDVNSVFQLLSVSKQFIATSIMLLIESGKTSLNQSITLYLPNVPSSWKNITVKFT